ncbi:MAG: chemotaxis protein CheB [Treponema sp.]|nr:chemotaxis protein CheB [Treponema sp.]
MSDKIKNLLAELKQAHGIVTSKFSRHAETRQTPENSPAEKKDDLPSGRKFTVLCIGASTGGPSAVQTVLQGLGENFPLPVLYAQHLDVGADEKMAKWFSDTCPNIPVTLAKDGEVAQPGHAYLAPAEKHLVIDRIKNGLPVMHLSDEPPERFLRPAVNKLFRSAAKFYKTECLAILMTGMGADGAEGCKEIVGAGGYTICEDKSTCKVFGMPAAAIAMDAASKVLPRGEVAPTILKLVK